MNDERFYHDLDVLNFHQNFLPARRYGSATTMYDHVSVYVTSRCSIEMVERIGLAFWNGSFFPPILQCVLRKFRYLQK